MPTPHCPVCGRWDGSHSGGCPNTGKPYPGTAHLMGNNDRAASPAQWFPIDPHRHTPSCKCKDR